MAIQWKCLEMGWDHYWQNQPHSQVVIEAGGQWQWMTSIRTGTVVARVLYSTEVSPEAPHAISGLWALVLWCCLSHWAIPQLKRFPPPPREDRAASSSPGLELGTELGTATWATTTTPAGPPDLLTLVTRNWACEQLSNNTPISLLPFCPLSSEY
jgi:hypothetical protein